MTLTAEQQAWVDDSRLRGPAFEEPLYPVPRLIAIGAVPLAGTLTRLARNAGFRTFVVDPRARFNTPARFPDAEEAIVAWPQEGFERAGGLEYSTAVIALAHDPVLDDPALTLALRSPARYVGAMGSRRTQAARRERLAAAGLTAAELNRLSGPAGLDLGARTAPGTALSILAEIVGVIRGREGGRLTSTGQAIHDEEA